MEGQEDEMYLEQATPSKEEEGNEVSSPQSNKKVGLQITFNKDRVTGMYKCQMCSYKSMHRSSIKSHYAVHSSLRPYACDQCAYEAKRLNDLRKHKLIKHGKKLISVRKKSSFDGKKKSNGISSGQIRSLLSENEDMKPDTSEDAGENSRNNILYQSLLGTSVNGSGNGPVFPQPEPASLAASSPEQFINQAATPLEQMRPISPGDIPEDVDKEGTMVVKPEPPDDYYTFQRNPPEQDGPIVISTSDTPPPISSPNDQVQNLSIAGSNAADSPSPHSPKSPRGSAISPALSHKSAQSTCKDTQEADSSRLHAASPSVISLLLQRRNLTGSSLLAVNQGTPSSSMPRQLRPAPRPANAAYNQGQSGGTSFYTVDQATSSTYPRYSTPQYNPLNLSYNHQQQQNMRSSSESSHSSSIHNTPHSSTHGSHARSVAMGTKRGWQCEHCDIMFFDSAIYFMHMGLHGTESAWQCNLCGMQLYDVYSFTSHFVNGHAAC